MSIHFGNPQVRTSACFHRDFSLEHDVEFFLRNFIFCFIGKGNRHTRLGFEIEFGTITDKFFTFITGTHSIQNDLRRSRCGNICDVWKEWMCVCKFCFALPFCRKFPVCLTQRTICRIPQFEFRFCLQSKFKLKPHNLLFLCGVFHTVALIIVSERAFERCFEFVVFNRSLD